MSWPRTGSRRTFAWRTTGRASGRCVRSGSRGAGGRGVGQRHGRDLDAGGEVAEPAALVAPRGEEKLRLGPLGGALEGGPPRRGYSGPARREVGRKTRG